jgi:hypothetical protein
MGRWNFRDHAVFAVARCVPIDEEHTLVKLLFANGYAYHAVCKCINNVANPTYHSRCCRGILARKPEIGKVERTRSSERGRVAGPAV